MASDPVGPRAIFPLWVTLFLSGSYTSQIFDLEAVTTRQFVQKRGKMLVKVFAGTVDFF